MIESSILTLPILLLFEKKFIYVVESQRDGITEWDLLLVGSHPK